MITDPNVPKSNLLKPSKAASALTVFIITIRAKKIMTFWIGFLNSKVTRQHAAHLLNSSADPGHVGGNVGVDVEHIFLCRRTFRLCCLGVHCSWSQATNVHLSTLKCPRRADKTNQTTIFCGQGSSAVTLESYCKTDFVRLFYIYIYTDFFLFFPFVVDKIWKIHGERAPSKLDSCKKKITRRAMSL